MQDGHDVSGFESESTGYLISVSDIMAGLLFIFIITLAAFILNFHEATAKTEQRREILEKEVEATQQEKIKLIQDRDKTKIERDKLQLVVDDLTNTQQIRAEMLLSIQEELLRRSIKVIIDEQHGILRLTENAIEFDAGKAELEPSELEKLSIIAKVLLTILPQYTATPSRDNRSNIRIKGKLESVFVEGHTDNMPINISRSKYLDNWELSTERAIYTYKQLIKMQPGLDTLINLKKQPVFSVSGYGEGRPICIHKEPTLEPLNRRIDLRFVMTSPKVTKEVLQTLEETGVK